MLSNCNVVSAGRLERALRDFKAHAAAVAELKRDADNVLRRTRALKLRLAERNPDAFRGDWKRPF